jgi:hypothetical protein
VPYDKQSVVDELRRLGYREAAADAARELPEQPSEEEIEKFGDQHGISRDELVNRMGGSP